jgi:hypothetical protein
MISGRWPAMELWPLVLEGSQFGLGEAALGEPPLYERGLEGADHLFAVGVRRPQVATAHRTRCFLVSWPCRHQYHPHLQNAKSVGRPRGCSGVNRNGTNTQPIVTGQKGPQLIAVPPA